MKKTMRLMSRVAASVALCMTFSGTAFAQAPADADAQLVARGHYLATAADCAACHGAKSEGGLAIATPMGKVYASNISPDPVNGIGKWSLKDFSDALRKGRAPGKGWLYPAMPYTSYTGLSDDDVKALYSYFQLGVTPSTHKAPETNLPFPFMRVDMLGWNLLNLKEGTPSGSVPVNGETLERGRYLVETLGHCSMCHTARNSLMGEINSEHLAGGLVGPWVAPNITPSSNGIGGWSDADLKKFLTTGSANNHIAAGDMGLAVEHSFSHLSDADIDAMVAYLRKVPPVPGAPTYAPAATSVSMKQSDLNAAENLPDGGTTPADYLAVKQGAVLYQAACAACHSVNGTGTPDKVHPSLLQNGTARMLSPNNLIEVIGKGIDVKTPYGHQVMPRFDDQMSPDQIAAVATYVRSTFGNVHQPDVTGDEVSGVLAGAGRAPWLIRHAAILAIVGMIVGIAVLILIIRVFVRRGRRTTAR